MVLVWYVYACHVCFFHIFPHARRSISLTPSSIYSRGIKDGGNCGVSSARFVLEELPAIDAGPIHGAVPCSSLKCGPLCWSSLLAGTCLSPCLSCLPLPLCRWMGWGLASRRCLLGLRCLKQGCCCEGPAGCPCESVSELPQLLASCRIGNREVPRPDREGNVVTGQSCGSASCESAWLVGCVPSLGLAGAMQRSDVN